MRVLYIDDDRINTLLFVETCRLAGHLDVEVAASGAEALQTAATWRPELLVIDLHLPDTNGYELLPALRQCLAEPSLPAVLCTADDAFEVQAPARAAGFNDCWSKPVDLQQVIAALTRYCVRSDRAAE
jgi:two-component system, OmpR family, response regulator